MIEAFWQMNEGELFRFLLKLSPEEAVCLFNEFISRKDERLATLLKRFEKDNFDSCQVLNYSSESLVPLWTWGRKQFTLHEYTTAELQASNQLPTLDRQGWLCNPQFANETRILILDVAYYFAEIFIRQADNVKWVLHKAKFARDDDTNYPVLSGFTGTMSPIHLIETAAYGSLSHHHEDTRLLELHGIWSEFLA